MLEKPLKSPLECKEIQPVNPKGNQPWIFIGRTDAEVEAPILWPRDLKSWLIGKDPDAGRDWRQEEKGANRGWDGWMASLTQGTWTSANSRRQWRTEEACRLQSMASQRDGHALPNNNQWKQREQTGLAPTHPFWVSTVPGDLPPFLFYDHCPFPKPSWIPAPHLHWALNRLFWTRERYHAFRKNWGL